MSPRIRARVRVYTTANFRANQNNDDEEESETKKRVKQNEKISRQIVEERKKEASFSLSLVRKAGEASSRCAKNVEGDFEVVSLLLSVFLFRPNKSSYARVHTRRCI